MGTVAYIDDRLKFKFEQRVYKIISIFDEIFKPESTYLSFNDAEKMAVNNSLKKNVVFRSEPDPESDPEPDPVFYFSRIRSR